MSNPNNKKNKKKTKGNFLPSEELVTICLKSAPLLHSLHSHFVDLIETLEDNFLKKRICSLAISLLQNRALYERIMKIIRNFAIDKDSIPRSLRSKMIDLVPTVPASARTQEFMAITEEASAFHKSWQKGFKNFFRRVKEVDRNETIKILRENFFDNFLKIVQVKSCHTFVQQSNIFKKSFKDSDKIFLSFIWKTIFDEFEKVSSLTSPHPPSTVTGLPPSVTNLPHASNNAAEVMVLDDTDEDEQKTTEADSIQVSASNVATAIQAEAIQDPIPDVTPILPSEERGQQNQSLTTTTSHPFITLSKYLNLTVDDIKEKVFEKINAPENTVKPQGNPDISACVSKVTNFILSTIPAVTTAPLDAYNCNLKVLEADELAAKMLAEDEIDNSTRKVADAISKETTMETPRMLGLINKASKKAAVKEVRELSKNLRAGKKVTFQKALPPSTKNHTRQPKKHHISRVRTKKGSGNNPSSSNSNSNNNSSNPPKKKKRQHSPSQKQQNQNPNQARDGKRKRRKTFKSMKWVRPKNKNKENVESQDE